MKTSILREAARRTALALHLPEDWLNDAAKGYVHGLSLGEVVLDRPTLVVRTLPPHQLLAIKLSAWRDDVDIEDARLLLSKLSGDRSSRISCLAAKRRRTTRFATSGRRAMDLSELVRALVSFDSIAARQWIADSVRQPVLWSAVPRPTDLSPLELAVAAGVVELLASRAGQGAPSWVTGIEGIATRVWLVRAASTMPRLRRLCEKEGPEPLRRRGIFAPPESLTVA